MSDNETVRSAMPLSAHLPKLLVAARSGVAALSGIFSRTFAFSISVVLIGLAGLGLASGATASSASAAATDTAPGTADSRPATGGQTGVTQPGGTTGANGESPVGSGSKPARRSLKRIRLRLVRQKVRFGQTVKVAGNNGLDRARRVRIQHRRNGRKGWRTVARIRSRQSGRFKGHFRARFAGKVRALDSRGRASSGVRIKVRSRTKLKRVARTVRLGNSVRIRGAVRPQGVRRIRLRIKGSGKSIRIRSRANGTFAYRWKPSHAGDVRVRARVLGDRHGGGDASGFRRISALRPGGASYFGPGLYGNGVACGGTLTPSTRGVAHKSLPCGTKVTIRYGNRTVTTRVIDRGPYIAGRDWDLTTATRNQLGFGGVGTVWTNR